jgi:hypothetical protein
MFRKELITKKKQMYRFYNTEDKEDTESEKEENIAEKLKEEQN